MTTTFGGPNYFLRPTKKKIILSLIPFVPVVFMLILLINIPFSFPFADALTSLQLCIVILAYAVVLLMAFPLKPVLISFGMWEYHSGFFIPFSGPEVSLSGMILVAAFYSSLIYVSISFLSRRKSSVDY